MASYDDAVRELYRTPHAEFVAERKRIAGELKAGGDKEGAGRLAKLPRPPISAWAVNQLWWQARDAFEAMLASAERLRDGELAATAAHRESIAKLRARAAAILAEAGNAAAESTLRRVTTTLSAIAASGGFAPDPPGALGDDRDPPGFDAMGFVAVAPAPAAPAPAAPAPAAPAPTPAARPALRLVPAPAVDEAAQREAARRAEEAAQRAAQAEQRRSELEAAAEQRRVAQEAARKHAERQRIEAALRTASGEIEYRQRELVRLREAVGDAETKLAHARAIAADLEARLAELAD